MGTAGLIEMNHLVILHLVPTVVKVLRLLLTMGDDGSEEGHTLIALPNPEGDIHGTHVLQSAGTAGTDHQRYDTQQVCHNGAKVRKKLVNKSEFIRKSSLCALCTLLQTFFLGDFWFISYLCINQNKGNDMILTHREIFLLIICAVIYITLFVVTIQYHRRKIQLLQSRLDNIHAMQKMAVIEQREHDVNTIFSSPVYLRIKQYLNDGQSMHNGDWHELAEVVNMVYNGFTEKLYSLYNMSDQDYYVSLLIKVRVAPKDIAILTAHSKESVASTRSRLYTKVFGKKGSTKDWDDFILSI